MPSRSPRTGRRLSPLVLIQDDQVLDDDLDVEVNYSDEEEGSEAEGSEEEQSVGEGCGAAVRARVSRGAAERPNMPTCPVCMEAWTAQGAHRISCIPCGHVYGRSCLEKWLTQRGNSSATCPQCGGRFKHKDIINLYAPEVAVPNNDIEKQVLYLREKAESLEKRVKLLEEISAQKRQIMSEQRSTDAGSSKRQKMAERSDGTTYLEPSTSATADFSSGNSCHFVLQNELFLDGARVMGIDASNQIILASGRAPGVGGEHVLTKISMLSSHEARKIHLPANTKAVRDICILPGGSAIFASLGRRLSLFRILDGCR